MARRLKPYLLRPVSATSEGLHSETLPHFLGIGVVGFANPNIGNHSSVGKVVQILQKSLTCYNNRAHGYERHGSFMISGYYGWLGIDMNLIIHYYHLGFGNVH